MDELITELRNRTHMGRFSRGEVLEVLTFLEAGGYLAPAESPADLPPVETVITAIEPTPTPFASMIDAEAEAAHAEAMQSEDISQHD